MYAEGSIILTLLIQNVTCSVMSQNSSLLNNTWGLILLI